MAIKRIRYPEWRDAHEPTKYPFEDDATLSNDAGDTVPPNVFLDAAIYPMGGQLHSYLRSIVVSSDQITINIGDSGSLTRASVSFDRFNPPDELRLLDAYNRPAGIIVSTSLRLSAFSSWPVGEHVFSYDDTPFVAAVVAPAPDVGVRGFLLDDGNVVSKDVWLVGGEGVVLTCDTATIAGECGDPDILQDVIRVDIIGNPLWRRALCAEEDAFATPSFLRSLTFCTPEKPAQTTDVEGNPSTDAADILFLTDTTGSMMKYITDLQTVFGDIVDSVQLSLPKVNIRWAIADYRDHSDSGAYLSPGVNIGQGFTEDTAAAQAALDLWAAGGGGDTKENQFEALNYLAQNWTGLSLLGRSGAQKIIVWAGDAAGNVYTVTKDAAIASLAAAGVSVLAMNIDSVSDGIDGSSEATDIATGSGGSIDHDIGADSTTVVQQRIEDAITASVEDGGLTVPRVAPVCFTCGPGQFSDIKITAGSQDSDDPILRIHPAAEGMVIEAVGEKMESIR
jgi:hypothetical protein